MFVLTLDYVDGAALYRAFLLREFSNENLEFWQNVEEYKSTKSQKMAAKAQKIYNDFVAVQAPKEVCDLINSFRVFRRFTVDSHILTRQTFIVLRYLLLL